MNDSRLKADQVEIYVSSLTPKAAAALLREVERDKLNGGNAFPHDLIIAKARKALENTTVKCQRANSPLGYFVQPLEDLLTTKTVGEKLRGRIARSSIKPIWNWCLDEICAEFLPYLVNRINAAAEIEDDEWIRRICSEMHAVVGQRLHETLDPIEEGTREYSRLQNRLGGEQVLEDAREFAAIFPHADAIQDYCDSIPESIDSLQPEQIDAFVRLYSEAEKTVGDYAFIVLMAIYRRLRHHDEVLMIVAAIAASERAAVIEQHAVSAVCRCLIYDLELLAEQVSENVTSGSEVLEIQRLLGEFQVLCKGFTGFLELDMKSAWGMQIVACRSQMSQAIHDQIAAAPRLIKKAMFNRSTTQSGGVTFRFPDEESIERAEWTTRLLLGVRPYLDQLTLNQEIASAQAEVEQFVQIISERLLVLMKNASGDEAEWVHASLAAAVRITHIVFGADAGHHLERRGRSVEQPKAISKAAF